MCKRLEIFTGEKFENVLKYVQKDHFQNHFVTMATEYLTIYFIFSKSRYFSSYVAEFCDRTFQDEKIMNF